MKKGNPLTNEFQWDKDSWNKMRKKLRCLDLTQLLHIAKIAGVNIADGKPLKDRLEASVRDQIVLILDEVSPRELKQAYDQVVKKRVN